MTSKHTGEQTRGAELTPGTPQSGKREQLLAAQHERFDRLQQRMVALRALKDRECELEVELIAAEAAHKAPLPPDKPGLDPGKAGLVAEALTRTGRLRDGIEKLMRQNSPAARLSTSELARYKSAEEALNAWLDAPGTVKRRELAPLTQALLGIALLTCIWAGFTFSLIFLVLLVPLGLPFSFMALSSHDLSWVRLGARRRFEATRLDPPAAWKTAEVATRRSEIEDFIRQASAKPTRQTDVKGENERDVVLKETQLLEAETQLQMLMAEAGLDAEDMSEDVVRWLTLEGEARATRRELANLKAKVRSISAEIDADREEVFRFLSRQGEAPPDGRADIDTLAAGLARVARAQDKAHNQPPPG